MCEFYLLSDSILTAMRIKRLLGKMCQTIHRTALVARVRREGREDEEERVEGEKEGGGGRRKEGGGW